MLRTLFTVALLASASAAGAQPVAVTLSEFKIGMTRDTVKAGPVTFRVKNSGVMAHAFYVIGDKVDKVDKVDKGTPDIPAGQEASLTLTLKAGTYEGGEVVVARRGGAAERGFAGGDAGHASLTGRRLL